MNIDIEILMKYRGTIKKVEKNEIIFTKSERSTSYYQVLNGKVKMIVANEDGKEFIQGFFSDGESFGEPPLILKSEYPATAVAAEKSTIVRCSYHDFFQLLKDNPAYYDKLTFVLAKRLLNKSKNLQEISIESAEHRVNVLINHYFNKGNNNTHLPYTRQDIADMTGLRVETVIKIIKKMETSGLLDIVNGKIHKSRL